MKMSKSFSILHISDLHRSPADPISNAELISALVGDRERYVNESPRIPAPEAIVVSGDLIQGLPLGATDYEAKLDDQYAVAHEFLDELVKRFLDGDRSRVVIIPGNHDVDWNTALEAMEVVHPKDAPKDILLELHSEGGRYRWDWKNLTLYRIRDAAIYERRLAAFWRFFEQFYSGVHNLLKVKPRADANLFSLCDGRIGVAAFNSCHGNDCFAFHGMVRKDVVARSHLELNDSGQFFDLRMAVWHHSIEGPPYRTDYMDIEIVRGMIGRGFRLGLYGHQHKAQVVPHQVWMPDQERMAVVSAGSLCAGAYDLPTGTFRQYNVLEIAEDFSSVRIHVRSMSVANLFLRGQLPDFGGASFADLDWRQPQNIMGGVVNVGAARRQAAIEAAELAVKSGDRGHAIEILRQLDLLPGSYERDLILSAASDEKKWPLIIEVTNPPTTITELVQRIEASIQLKKPSEAREALDKYAHQLNLDHALQEELRQRINAQEVIRR